MDESVGLSWFFLFFFSFLCLWCCVFCFFFFFGFFFGFFFVFNFFSSKEVQRAQLLTILWSPALMLLGGQVGWSPWSSRFLKEKRSGVGSLFFVFLFLWFFLGVFGSCVFVVSFV